MNNQVALTRSDIKSHHTLAAPGDGKTARRVLKSFSNYRTQPPATIGLVLSLATCLACYPWLTPSAQFSLG
ncbi:MAG: hypothetical protein NTW52_03150 [Planctomycetota bacterium]|nr:hypothetical protein [Planctomycetota bacterium]